MNESNPVKPRKQLSDFLLFFPKEPGLNKFPLHRLVIVLSFLYTIGVLVWCAWLLLGISWMYVDSFPSIKRNRELTALISQRNIEVVDDDQPSFNPDGFDPIELNWTDDSGLSPTRLDKISYDNFIWRAYQYQLKHPELQKYTRYEVANAIYQEDEMARTMISDYRPLGLEDDRFPAVVFLFLSGFSLILPGFAYQLLLYVLFGDWRAKFQT
jgi:hypothetical protein